MSGQFKSVIGLAVLVVLFAFALAYTMVVQVGQTNDACRDRKRQYDALHAVIIEQNKPQKPSEVILRAFPQFRPFYTPGTPEFDEAARIAAFRREAALGVLGGRPVC